MQEYPPLSLLNVQSFLTLFGKNLHQTKPKLHNFNDVNYVI